MCIRDSNEYIALNIFGEPNIDGGSLFDKVEEIKSELLSLTNICYKCKRACTLNNLFKLACRHYLDKRCFEELINIKAKEEDINLDELKCLHCVPVQIDGMDSSTEEVKAIPCHSCEENTSPEMSAKLICSHRVCKKCVEVMLNRSIITGSYASCKCGVTVDTETVFPLNPDLCACYMERVIL
eukprot:TRINITY_DN11246_c0_g1_i2.p1 TRINITY_DN11246_c0_g1~~TRINITY_DN11246_c0_g1_i2.p1  ORF type:complete len:183 (+),score=33.42 TRINITY_DN11246_c0_g1_i2:72-620(+)